MLETTRQPVRNVLPQSLEEGPGLSAWSGRPEEALLELYELLESHAPAWYTEGHHHRAEFALRLAKKR